MAAMMSSNTAEAEVKLSKDGEVSLKDAVRGQKRTAAGAGRLAMAGVLSACCVAVLFADNITFGGGGLDDWSSPVKRFTEYLGSSNCVAELTLIVSAALLALAQYGPGWSKRGAASRPVASARGGAAGEARKATRRGSESSQQAAAAAPGSEAARKSNAAVMRLNQAIDAAARQGDAVKAGELLLEFERLGGSPECVSYNLVIRACAKMGNSKAAERWLTRMEEKGVPATVCSYNTLLDACAKSDEAEACEAWLQRMQGKGLQPNVISYATAIYARARRGDVAQAEAWMQRMIASGVEPDAVSFNSLIHACSVKCDASSAERWLEEMQARGLETSVATYTAVIDACAKTGDVERAGKWFSRMLEKGVVPNVVTFSAMIDACAKAGDLPRAEHWHNRMVESGVTPNSHSYSAVVNACAKHGGPEGAEAAERWLDRSEQAGVANDAVVYSGVIDACGKAGDTTRAMRVFRRMKANGLKPHIVAYAALARPFAYRGDWMKVEAIAQMVAEGGVAVNEYFLYAQLLSYAVARPRQAQRAEQCFREALVASVKANDYVVGVLARAVGRARCMELMDELCGGREVPAPAPRRGQEGPSKGNASRARQ